MAIFRVSISGGRSVYCEGSCLDEVRAELTAQAVDEIKRAGVRHGEAVDVHCQHTYRDASYKWIVCGQLRVDGGMDEAEYQAECGRILSALPVSFHKVAYAMCADDIEHTSYSDHLGRLREAVELLAGARAAAGGDIDGHARRAAVGLAEVLRGLQAIVPDVGGA